MTSKLIQKVGDIIIRHKMLKYGDRILVGVSAGPDSVCLLHVLNEIREEYNLSLHIAHLHHGFRGEEADEDVRFVQSLGEKLKIPRHIEYADIPSYIKERGLSKQAGAREVRYNFFFRVADEIGADRIAVGHTADDQIETFLMRMIKGSGPHGLSGIPPVRERIVRPLIEVSREEVKGYLSERDILYRIDSSNLSPIYLRNKIRLELIPHIVKEYNPNIIETLMRNLTILRDEDIFLDEYTRKIYPGTLIGESKEAVRFDILKLLSLSRPIRRRILRQAIEYLAIENLLEGGVVNLSFRHVEDSLDLLESDRGGEIHLPSGIIAKKDRESFGVYLRPKIVTIAPYSYNIPVPGDTLIPDAGIIISTDIRTTLTLFLPRQGGGKKGGGEEKGEGVFSDGRGIKAEYRYKACFDMGRFSMPLTVRNRRPGDIFCPSGMGGRRKKIKEYIIDMKIPRAERERIPILTAPEGILWVIGYRTDERFRVTTATEKMLKMRVFKS